MSGRQVLPPKAPSDSHVLQASAEAPSRHETPSLDGALGRIYPDEGQMFDGASLQRLVRVTTLLSLLDPVRGEPTVNSLDSHPHDLRKKPEYYMVKFLDSFAWISSDNEKSGRSAAAVCLERDPLIGTTLRLCRNNEVPPELTESLQEILDKLSYVSSGAGPVRGRETGILQDVVTVCRKRIRSLFEALQKDKVQAMIKESIERKEKEDMDSAIHHRDDLFRNWLQRLNHFLELNLGDPAVDYTDLVQWASQARWVYLQEIEDTFFPDEENPPWWIYAIYKIGRYFTAVQSMVRFARREQDLFESIQVKAVPVPGPCEPRFTASVLRQDQLELAIKRCKLDSSPTEIIRQLGTSWKTDDPCGIFHKALTKQPIATVHAEMQLLSFYDHNPKLKPNLLFMGTSKKACFLCHEVMKRHYLGMKASASHQKIYPSWTPAPSANGSVRKLYKGLLWELTRHMETLANSDVRTRLGLGRRGRNLDSTAGLSSITGSVNDTELW